MTKEELNEKCCRFAGIEPERYHHVPPCASSSAWSFNSKPSWCRCSTSPVYPPVSTDWGAAGRLMDALTNRGERMTIEVNALTAPGHKRFRINTSTHEPISNDSFPMALALTVAELAKESKP